MDKQKIEDGRQFREAHFEVATRECEDGKKKAVIRASVSSEAPYLRAAIWDEEEEGWRKGYEVLGHADGEIDMSRMRDGLVVQDTHWGDQIGIMRSPEVKDGKIVGEIDFGCGERAQEIARDAAAGIRRNMSVGYIVKKAKRVGKAEDGLPIYRVTSWTPYEASFVNVPADTGVGVGRSHEQNGGEPAANTRKEVQIMDKPETKAGLTANQKLKVRELAASAHVSGEEVVDILASERSFEEIREELLNKREKYLNELAKKPAKPVGEVKEVIDEDTARKVRKAYNFTNVLRYLAAKTTGEGSLPDIGFEREISQEIAQKTGRAAQGILLPDFIRTSTEGEETLARPAHGTVDGLGGNGQATIATNLMAGNFIEALVDALVLRGLGMETITGLVGNVAIPKGGSIEAGWISSEGGNAAKKNPTFGQITATPHTCGAYTDITRQLLNQSSMDVQAKVTGWLLYACAACMEKACFQGSGSNGEPTGLSSLIGNAHTKAWSNAPTYAKLVELIGLCRKDNTFIPAMRFVGDNGVWNKLASTRDITEVKGASDATVAAVGGNYLLNAENDIVLGKQFVESHLMPAKTLFFGDFSQLSLCLWSGTDIIVDPYANSTAGGLRIVALQDADVIVKRPEAFAKATGVHA